MLQPKLVQQNETVTHNTHIYKYTAYKNRNSEDIYTSKA